MQGFFVGGSNLYGKHTGSVVWGYVPHCTSNVIVSYNCYSNHVLMICNCLLDITIYAGMCVSVYAGACVCVCPLISA